MKNTVIIREAAAADREILTKIIRNSFKIVAGRFNLTPDNCPKHPSNCTEEWIDNDFARGARYFILESNNTPVGCVALEHPNPDQCYLERLAVLPEEQKKGFGKKLVEYIIELAKELNAREIGIGIISEQGDLKEWYREIGFTEGEIKKFSHLPFQVAFMTYRI